VFDQKQLTTKTQEIFSCITFKHLLKASHHRLNHRLIEQGLVSLDTRITDSKPIMAATRENNLRNPARHSTCKSEKPARNPAATLSYYSCQILNGKKENMIFFWGYRTHVIISRQGIALVEICQGGLEMKSAGRWTEGNRERLKFRCPLKTEKKVG
jgi:hypothetical protein